MFRVLSKFGLSLLSFKHRPAKNADTEDVEPALAEIEQVRVEQRSHYVADDDGQSVPSDQRLFTK